VVISTLELEGILSLADAEGIGKALSVEKLSQIACLFKQGGLLLFSVFLDSALIRLGEIWGQERLNTDVIKNSSLYLVTKRRSSLCLPSKLGISFLLVYVEVLELRKNYRFFLDLLVLISFILDLYSLSDDVAEFF